MIHKNKNTLPRHIAIVMDGNGRWAEKHKKPRLMGHRAGAQAVRKTVKTAAEAGVEILSLFAFSTENWRRPPKEVQGLMQLFLRALKDETKELHKNNIQLRVIGELTQFSDKLRQTIIQAEQLTAQNTGLKLIIAANYGGQWDIVEATRKLMNQVISGSIQEKDINTETFAKLLATADLPDPDLFIRTSGEQRISNFFLWQLAYSELYFTDVLWPEFDEEEFKKALKIYAERKRRFGGA